MPFDDAVGAAGQRQATGVHRLDLAIAHAGEISADDVAGRLEHALLTDKCPGVETRPPRSGRVWHAYGDRRVHAAGLGADRVNRRRDEIGRAGRELKMGTGLDLRSTPACWWSSNQLTGGVTCLSAGRDGRCRYEQWSIRHAAA